MIDGKPITVEDFKKEIANNPGEYTSREQKEDLLKKRVNFELLYAAAEKDGYDKDEEIRSRFRRMIVNKYKEDILEPRVDKIEANEAEIEDFYNTHAEDFAIPRKVRAAVIRISIPLNTLDEKKEELLKRAEEARAEALNLDPETPFLGSVAVKYSDHQKTRYRGGDIGWLEEGKADHRWEREVTEAFFSLSEPGEISPVITTKKAHYIIKLMETKKASVRPLDQVRDRIRYQLMKQKREQIENEFLDELKGRVSVKVFSSRLDTIKPPKAASREKTLKPPALPGQKKEKEM